MTTLTDHLTRQIAFSRATFGPDERHKGVISHIRKELAEIAADPQDVSEYVDVVILAFDGAWRAISARCPDLRAPAIAEKIAGMVTSPYDRDSGHISLVSIVRGVRPMTVEDVTEALNEVEHFDGDPFAWGKLCRRSLAALYGTVRRQRLGGFSDEIAFAAWNAVIAKQSKNEWRVWPDWRATSADVAIEHVRGTHD